MVVLNSTGLAFFGFNFSFFLPASPPFSHGIFQPRPQEIGSLRQAFPMKFMYCLTQSVPRGRGGGGVLPYKRLIGCAAGCGRTFSDF